MTTASTGRSDRSRRRIVRSLAVVAAALAVTVVAACQPTTTPGGGGATTTTVTTGGGGSSTTTSSTVPGATTTTLVPGGNTPPTVVAGRLHTCSLRWDGTVRCWGNNSYGQLGTGDTMPKLVPTKVVGLDGVVAVAAGGLHTCALRVNGEVRCWGNNGDGQLGDGSTTSSSSPVVPFNLSTLAPVVTAITAGGSHSCALRSDGRAFCWGDNFSGQLGTGTSGNTGPTPRSVASLSGITALAAGDAHTCALRTGGVVSCWGDNYNGQLGNGTFTNSSSAVSVSGISNATALVTGSAFTCVNRSTGVPACWGENLYGQLGNGAVLPPPPGPDDPPPPPLRESLPQDVVGLTGVTAIGRGSDHACAVIGTGNLSGVSCWGRNDSNQISSGAEEASSTPQPTSVLGANQVSGGDSHTCIMKSNGTAQCWGANGSGQLGTNNTNSSTFPVAVVAL